MLRATIVRLVDIATRHPWPILVLSLALAVLSGLYAGTHFAITTDSSQLIAPDVAWRRYEAAFNKAFPSLAGGTVVVVDADTPGHAEAAAAALTARLSMEHQAIRSARRPDGGAFFAREGLLFLPTDEVRRLTGQLAGSAPLLAAMAADPSLRGLMTALDAAAQGMAEQGMAGQAAGGRPRGGSRPRGAQASPDAGAAPRQASLGAQATRQAQGPQDATAGAMATALPALADAVEDAVADRPSTFSWRTLLTGPAPQGGGQAGNAQAASRRKLILVDPVLDYDNLEPGHLMDDAVRGSARALGLTPEHGVTVRLTGDVPMGDEEFGTLAEGAGLNGALTVLAVLVILWLALRSARIILAVVVSLVVGLAVTAAAGLVLVGAYNLISVAFAVLFVGLGVDFGIQFSVRYREERHKEPRLGPALHNAAHEVARPLLLAAVATAAGFYSFLPTSYRGLSELGLIAGTGMIVAFLTSVTVLPAVLALLRPPGEATQVGFTALAPLDRFLERHRVAMLVLTLGLVAAGLPLLRKVHFDFNPIHLRSASTEAVSTFTDLTRDPDTSPATIHILEHTLADAAATAAKVEALPEVERALTLASFIPGDQDAKLALIKQAGGLLDPALAPPGTLPPPSDAETVAAIRRTLGTLQAIARAMPVEAGAGTNPMARLGPALAALASAGPDARARAQSSIMGGLPATLADLRTSLAAGPVTPATMPPEIRDQWLSPAGEAAVQVFGRGDTNDNDTLRRFAAAVRRAVPEATGYPVTIQDAGDTIVRAFLQAGALALASITVLLFLVLRNPVDVALTLIPLLLAGVVTLELTALFDMPLNFANIIALPLLLGVGVAFKVYFVMAWRSGQTRLLESSLTRAVLFSASTTAVAFGSLWFSHHPGTSSMGKLLALSLACTLFAAVLFQPVLMGPPRQENRR